MIISTTAITAACFILASCLGSFMRGRRDRERNEGFAIEAATARGDERASIAQWLLTEELDREAADDSFEEGERTAYGYAGDAIQKGVHRIGWPEYLARQAVGQSEGD